MTQTLNTRTVQANGEAIKRLRTQRGWRVEDLAREAGCSERTIKSVESGRNAYPVTLRQLAEAFGVEYSTLTTDNVTVPPDTFTVTKKYTVEVTLRISSPDADDFDQTTDLPRIINFVASLIGSDDAHLIEPVSVKKGSTEITVTMTLDQLGRFLRAYVRNDLDHLNIASVKALDVYTDDYIDGDKTRWRAQLDRRSAPTKRRSPPKAVPKPSPKAVERAKKKDKKKNKKKDKL
jgi:transcriptional regulator with XRE-family HTH domain